jgi:hypothetical protein
MDYQNGPTKIPYISAWAFWRRRWRQFYHPSRASFDGAEPFAAIKKL